MDRNLTVGYFTNEDFTGVCRPYIGRIREVFFGWPGVLTCRSTGDEENDRTRIVSDLLWCRRQGILLDALFNCNCYGEDSISERLTAHICGILSQMRDCGLFPDVVTTTSPFIASVLRRRHPELRLRASVNMRIHGSIGFEACEELFDEFYVSRERQRDFSYMRRMREWADSHGKSLGMQVNSGCLRQCPYQTFHDNLHGHHRARQLAEGRRLGFELFRCREHFSSESRREDFLKGTWIRPEDVHLWSGYVELFKVSTRRVANPSRIIRAYAEERHDGDLLELLDPGFSGGFEGFRIENSRFPSDWATCGIGAACADDCRHCGRCARLLEQLTGKVA